MMNCRILSVTVTPAKAGVQLNKKSFSYWATNCVVQFARGAIDQWSMFASTSCLRDPAFAGMTNKTNYAIFAVHGSSKEF
jgi:hypothetical protein